MTVRLDEAAVAYEVRTAHIHTDPVSLTDVVTVPDALPDTHTTPAASPATYRTPVAALLERAQHRMTVGGWCSGALTDASGATCMMGAIRAEAGGSHNLEADALAVLRDALNRRFGGDISVPDFNDAHGSGRVPARMLGEAASLADARQL
ncbi:hypothetical protein FNH09_43565 [Streptomyces adustus]|uniref:Uncharacterized protein n=2 Tax=Streptomyces adustus TaxID=1609272 RepID=A0A5N8VSB8_9ACTN|nr:hypothetical protein [Streptomyces adustus]MPY37849.1 hypothetical protein [Streptomyces adustus]